MAEYDDTRATLQSNIDTVEFDRLIRDLLRELRGEVDRSGRYGRRAYNDVIQDLVGVRTGDKHTGVGKERRQLDRLQRPDSDDEIQRRIDELVRPEKYINDPASRQPTRRQMDRGQGGSGTTRRIVNPDYNRQLDEYNRRVNEIRGSSNSLPDVEARESIRTGGTITDRDQAIEQLRRRNIQDLIDERANELRAEADTGRINKFVSRDKFDLNQGMMDEIVQRALDEQFNLAQAGVQARQRRGDLDDAGFNEAMRLLTNQRGAANNQLNTIASSVLDESRQRLGDFQLGALDSVGNKTFDMGKFKTGMNDLYNRQVGGLEGALMAKVGGQQLFRPGEAVTRAGTLTGPTRGRSGGYFSGGYF